MEKTISYNIFKKNKSNRDINEKNVKRLMDSIQSQNLLHLAPIIVNKNMEIIDGQHRLEAAKRLGFEIFYIIEENIKNESMQLFNTNQSKWTLYDYINFYSQENYEEYIKLKNFMFKNKIDLCIALRMCGIPRGGKEQLKFKRGSFKFPSPMEELEMLDKLSNMKTFISYVSMKLMGEKKFLSSPTFTKAFFYFMNNKQTDFKLFMKKLPYRLDLLRPCSREVDFLTIFKEIYNYKNHNPIKDLQIEEEFA